jgi:hypothetical protein
MTYQPYPSGSGVGNQAPVAQRPPQPQSIRNALRLMWGGAGLALLGTIFTAAVLGHIKTALTNTMIKNNSTAHSQGKPVMTLAQIHAFVNGFVVALVVVGIISVLLWAWMAWAINRGASWARIVGTVLFALLTVEVVLSLPRASLSIFYILLEWLLGLAATILLWRKESSEYFAQSRRL